MILAASTSLDAGLMLAVIGAVAALFGLLWKVSQAVVMVGKVLQRIEQHDNALRDHADRMGKIEIKLQDLSGMQQHLQIRLAAETGEAK